MKVKRPRIKKEKILCGSSNKKKADQATKNRILIFKTNGNV